MAPITNPIIWIHGDNLNPYSPALQEKPNAPAIWVWDDAYLQNGKISLKRILFIYECLLELPVTIHRGNVVDELARFAQQHSTNRIVTMDSPAPGFARILHQLQTKGFQVDIYEEDAFVNLTTEPDLRRFSRYWRAAQTQLRQREL